MNKSNNTKNKDKLTPIIKDDLITSNDLKDSTNPKKGPLNFLSGALTSYLFGWLSFIISQRVVIYFALHTKEFNSPIAESVACGFKTLVIGMCFLATFTFTFIGIGLTIVFIRSLFDANKLDDE